MKAVRADLVDNLNAAHDEDGTGLLLDELTKAFLLFPKASNDILGTRDLDPKDLAHKAHKNGDTKICERLTKLMLLVNKRDSETGQFEATGELQGYSMRNLFSRNSTYFDSEKENIEAIADSLSEVLRNPSSAVDIGKNVDDYANFDGKKDSANRKRTWIIVGLVAVGILGAYGYYKFRSNAEV